MSMCFAMLSIIRKPLVEGLVLKYGIELFFSPLFRSPSWRGWY